MNRNLGNGNSVSVGTLRQRNLSPRSKNLSLSLWIGATGVICAFEQELQA